MSADDATLSQCKAGDAWGGFASMLVALPASIGYGVTIYAVLGSEHAGPGALAGLIGAIAIGLLAPRFGGSSRLISAPCGPAALLLSALAATLIAGQRGQGSGTVDAQKVLLVLTVVGFVAAGIQFAFGALGGGRLIKYIPYPVVAGYLSSIGILLFTKQIPELLGLDKNRHGWDGLLDVLQWSPAAVVIGLATMLGMVFGHRVTRRLPAVVLGLLSGAAVYAVASLFLPAMRSLDSNPLVVGRVGGSPSEFAAGLLARWRGIASLRYGDLSPVAVPALTLAVLLSIDTLKTCVIIDSITRTRSDSNRELRGQGLANFASSLLGGMPGAGTMGATLVNINSGGETRHAGMLEGLFALTAFVFFGGMIPGMPNLIGWIPRAALAGIIMVVSVRMIDIHILDLLRHSTTRLDFMVVAAVIATALLASPVGAAGVGLFLAIILFTREQIRGSVVRHKLSGNIISSKRQRPPDELGILHERGGSAVICQLQGTLFFGTTDQLFSILEADLKTCRYLVLDMKRVQSVDFTAAHMLEQMEAQLADRGAYLIFSSLPETLPTGRNLRAYFDQLGLVRRGRNALVFDDLDRAVVWVEDQILWEAGAADEEAGLPLSMHELSLFRELADDALSLLSEAMEERSIKAGAPVFHHGDDGDELFLIRHGSVDIRLPLEGGRSHLLATFSRGSFFGDMAFLDRGRRSADAIAVDDVEVFVLSRERFDELSRRHPATGAMLFARLARILALRLRQTDLELRTLLES
jgi:sulfate permease, SulP family